MTVVLGDNYRFDISGAPLSDALALAFLKYPKVVGWSVEKREGEPPRLILYWFKSKSMTPLPAPLSGESVVLFVQQWIDATEWEPKHPWSDVVTRKGVRVYNEKWGHVGGDHSAFVAIEPYQIWLGK